MNVRDFSEIREAMPSYHRLFNSADGDVVLRDLIDFCHVLDGGYDDDPRKHALHEGRRQVFLRITRYLNLTIDQLFTLYKGGNIHYPVPAPEPARKSTDDNIAVG